MEQLTPIKRALVEIRELRARLERAEKKNRDPIAIIGMGLRFPGGATDPRSFWQMLSGSKDAIGGIPPDRWDVNQYYDPDPDRPGKMNVRHGGFLDGIDQFDAEFFGISPREAVSMDPQHRLLLEVCWEALEQAGESPASLAGTQAGVFIGISNNDYIRMLLADQYNIDAYATAGNANSIATGRLSYLLGIHGPSIAVDTACSSSLVAVHLACQSLRLGESSLALAGGVNLILAPELNINFTKARMLAPDGRCKTFDAGANGYSRGEGCAVMLLKPLSAALADRNPILAVIRGSAVNQDGRSAGITAPNGPAQEAVIRAAIENADLSPADVTYVETHGTGTPLGDPIEVQALAAVLAQGRSPERPLMIGSVKTNLGHLEAAAGMAGLAKAVLALQNRAIPPHLHLHNKNPHINWNDLAVSVPTAMTPWPAGAPAVAGVSSFGISGTNAHVVLEAAPPRDETRTEPDRPLHVLALSARRAPALLDLAANYERLLAGTGADIRDICFTANAGRATFSHRLAIIGETAAEIRSGLRDFVANPQIEFTDTKPKLAFLYPGQGPQHAGMGAELYRASPTFRAAIDRCEELLQPYLDRKLTAILFPPPGDEAIINDTVYAQPAMFAIEYALTELWRSWGVEPAIVAGHSLGEFAAACAAGIFSLSDGLRLVAARGRLTGSLPPGGGMAVVFAPEDRVRSAIQPYQDSVAIAAINGRANVVISGALRRLDVLVSQFETEGVKCHRLKISNSFHSPLLEPVLDEFEAVAQTVTHACPKIGFISNLTGRLADAGKPLTGSYWRNHAREIVRFADGVETLYQAGVRHFLELGPKPVLGAIGMDSHVAQCNWYASLTPEKGDWLQMLETLRSLYLRGAGVNWEGFDRDFVRYKVDAPTYPFQRQRYWAVAPRNAPADTPAMPSPVSGAEVSEVATAPPAASAPERDILKELAAVPRERREERILAMVTERVCGVLRRDPSQPPGKRERLMDIGMDSLMAVQFRNLLQNDLELEDALPATLIFDYPTIESIVDMLLGGLDSPPLQELPDRPLAAGVCMTEEQLSALSDEEVEALLNQRLGVPVAQGPEAAARN